MKRALKTLGIMAGLLACQFCLGMLPTLAALFYVNVSRPLYQWLHLIP